MQKLKKALAAAIASSLCFTALPSMTAGYDNGLVLYYDFETEASAPSAIFDRSGNGNDATVLNQYGSLTVNDGTAVFSGPSYKDMGATLLLPDGTNAGITEFTYSAWINASGSTDGVRFFDFGNRSYTDITPTGLPTNAYNAIYLEYSPSSGRMRFQDRRIADVFDRNDPKSYVEAYLGDRPFNNDWAMLTVTYGREGSYYVPHIYINGVENKSFSSRYSAFTRSLKDLGDLSGYINGLYIGRNRWSEDGFDVGTNPDFTGKMDEIRLYNRTLSADEILSLYKDTRPGVKLDGEVISYTGDITSGASLAVTFRPELLRDYEADGSYTGIVAVYDGDTLAKVRTIGSSSGKFSTTIALPHVESLSLKIMLWKTDGIVPATAPVELSPAQATE